MENNSIESSKPEKEFEWNKDLGEYEFSYISQKRDELFKDGWRLPTREEIEEAIAKGLLEAEVVYFAGPLQADVVENDKHHTWVAYYVDTRGMSKRPGTGASIINTRTAESQGVIQKGKLVLVREA